MTSLPDDENEKTGSSDTRYVSAIEAIYEAAAEPARWPAALAAKRVSSMRLAPSCSTTGMTEV